MEQAGKTMENPLAIANYFVEKSLASGTTLTPMKLVKLVYLAHGWYLGFTSHPLLTEAVQAWQYGPVVPSVYEAFRHYGGEQIMAVAASRKTMPTYFLPTVQDEEIKTFLDRMWDEYSHYSGLELSSLTHQPNTPWDVTWNSNNGKSKRSTIIPNNLIEEYYKEKINVNRSEITA